MPPRSERKHRVSASHGVEHPFLSLAPRDMLSRMNDSAASTITEVADLIFVID